MLSMQMQNCGGDMNTLKFAMMSVVVVLATVANVFVAVAYMPHGLMACECSVCASTEKLC